MELTEAFLAKIAGWEVMKQARGLVERNQVIESNWSPPILMGIVQEGSVSYKAGLAVRGTIDIDNLCSCRASRQRGIICAHSVSVGLHYLKAGASAIATPVSRKHSVANNGLRTVVTERPLKLPGRSGKQLLRAADGQYGTSAQIHVIIPPNFTKSIERGSATICFEAVWNRGKSPLDALPENEPFTFSEQDLELLDFIEVLADGETPGMLSLNAEAFSELLARLVDHPRVALGRSHALTVASTPKRFSLTATLGERGEITCQMANRFVTGMLIPGRVLWVFDNEGFYPLNLPESVLGILQGPVCFGRERVPQFLSQDWERLRECCDLTANFKMEDFFFESLSPRFQLHLVGGLARLEARLDCVYGERVYALGFPEQSASFWIADPVSSTRYSTRDLLSERQAVELMRQSGFSRPNDQGKFQLFGENAVLSFFARQYREIEKKWAVTLEERLERSTQRNLERIEPQLRVASSGEQWFDLSVSFSSQGGERFSSADIQRLILSGQNHVRLKNGRVGLLDTGAVEELQEVLLDCSPAQDARGYRIQNAQAGFLESTIRERTPWKMEASGEWDGAVAMLSGTVKFTVPDLGGLDKLLRSYQRDGVAWLSFIRKNNFGGILADEMGLGKTVQTLAFLKAIRASPEFAVRGPSLVLCPTSLVHNWVDEVQKFTPDLKVLAIHGPQRGALFDQIESTDLVVTSYALIRRDADVYRQIEFDSVILDEAQHIKNRQTQNAQAVKSIRSRHRLVLTGTPLENSVLDLWSIFDFLMPGYLGSAADFKERYEIPIVRDKDRSVQSRLARRIRPFLLRRLKRDVAKELPEKIENVSFCELNAEQRQVYQQVLETGRREILDAAGPREIQKSRMIVLNTLLRLRQICCDVRLLGLENDSASSLSGKLELFHELLDEAIDGGHRVLVFSQFVSMLTLIRERLNAASIDYCYLDGKVVNRGEVVERFQKSAGIPLFLISLKAGGVGLNLTGADTVIHFDPWWNPAVEDQASDRAHRIGQTRVVTVYKLIARGTVEEKILNLQNRKRAVVGGILAGEEQAAESLTWEEIQELLA
ncbi:MAG: SNF2-related protein [Verrucomicrobia bacterium]|nr:SNF2-related protein [Verrucomicrobiota bacterium]